MAHAFCPDCDGGIRLNPNVSLGQQLVYPHCDAELEVIGVDPLELDWADSWTDRDRDEVKEEEGW
jgi:lysine biosynthesis protein LysW